MKNLFTLLAVAILAFGSCGKKDNPEPKTPTVRELLTSGTWYLEKLNGETAHSCLKRTSFSFLVNGTGVRVLAEGDGGPNCIVYAPVAFDYQLEGDKLLKMDGGTGVEIVKITDKEFIYMTGSVTFAFDKVEG